MTFVSVAQASRRLGIDAKTLRRWLTEAQLPLQSHPRDGRKKGVSSEHLQVLALLHQRSLAPLPQEPPASVADEPLPLPTVLLTLPERLDALQGQMTALQQQMAALTRLLQQHGQEPATLAAPTQQTRTVILDALREELRHRDYLPIVFDFDIPKNRDITETVSLLARMSRFVIADLTEARSIPQELSTIIPDLPSVPVQPILLATEGEYSMFEHFKRYPWVLQDYLYTSIESLLAALKTSVIEPAEQKAQELAKR